MHFEVNILDRVRPDFAFADPGPVYQYFDAPDKLVCTVDNNPASSATAPAAITYDITSDDPDIEFPADADVDTNGVVAIRKPGVYTVSATMAAKDPYVASTIEYTIYAKQEIDLMFEHTNDVFTFNDKLSDNKIIYSGTHIAHSAFPDPAINDLKFKYSLDDASTAKASIDETTGKITISLPGLL